MVMENATGYNPSNGGGQGSTPASEAYYRELDPSMRQSIFCYKAMISASSGIWFGHNPLNFSFPILLFQIIVIFVATRLTHAFLRHLSQPQVISQIITGIILGPTFIGRSKGFERLLYSVKSWEHINTLSIISFMLFLFMIGVKTDLTMTRNTGRKASAIAVSSTFLSAILLFAAVRSFGHAASRPLRDQKLISAFGVKWTITSYTVLASTLGELSLLTSKLGRLAMSASLIADFMNLLLSAALQSYLFGAEEDSVGTSFVLFGWFLAVMLFIVFVERPLILWVIKRTPEGSLLDEGSFVLVVCLALFSGLLTEIVGLHVGFGPFLLGLVLPGGEPLGVTLTEKMERVVGIFLPVYVVQAGLRMDLAALRDTKTWWFMEVLVAATALGKLVGVMGVCLYFRMSLRDALSLSLIMLQKGIIEVDAASFWLDAKLFTRPAFTVILLSIVVLGGVTAPLIKYLYRPEDQFVANKRRTVQHTKPGGELRVVACVFHQENVSSIISLLESTHPTPESPVCVYALHLLQLAGRSAAVLAPYKRSRSSNLITETDHIVNAFNYFAQQQSPGAVTVLPYTSHSPYATMHDDVCALALDKKAAIVLAPFHKHVAIDGTIESTSPFIQSVNVSVLNYCPCSVGILVPHGIAEKSGIRKVAVYFFGGPDDREALAYGARMAEDPAIGLTVVRFRLPKEMREGGREERLDDAMVEDFCAGRVDGGRVAYREEIVIDGEGTVGVIRAVSSHFGLLIVGRREGKESRLTRGLSAWNEYPELGVVGDLLASTDFGGKVSTLVVQQQLRYNGMQHGGESPKAAKKGQVMPADLDDS